MLQRRTSVLPHAEATSPENTSDLGCDDVVSSAAELAYRIRIWSYVSKNNVRDLMLVRPPFPLEDSLTPFRLFPQLPIDTHISM